MDTSFAESSMPDPSEIRADEVSDGAQLAFTVITAVPLAIMIGIAIHVFASRRDPMLGLFLIGGFCCVAYEPIVDILGACAFPENGQWTSISAFGSDVPVFVHMTYIWYVGGLAIVVLRMLERRASAKSLWILFGVLSVGEFVLEIPGLQLDLWSYYGEQPFEVLGFPLWWGPVNALMPMVSGAAIYLLRDYFTGPRLLLLVPVDVMADGVANAVAAWPVWLTLNSGRGLFVNYLGGVATFVMAAIAMSIIIHAVQESDRRTDELAALRAVADQRPTDRASA